MSETEKTDLIQMKILILLPSLTKGGVVLGAVALAKELWDLACEVIVASLASDSECDRSVLNELISADIQVQFLNMPGWLGLLMANRLKAFARSVGIDLICSFGIRQDYQYVSKPDFRYQMSVELNRNIPLLGQTTGRPTALEAKRISGIRCKSPKGNVLKPSIGSKS